MTVHRGKLLLVDDEEKILKALGRALRDAGHAVVETTSPRQAQRLLAERPFDVSEAPTSTGCWPPRTPTRPSRDRRVNATLLDFLARLDDSTSSGFLNGRPTSTRWRTPQ